MVSEIFCTEGGYRELSLSFDFIFIMLLKKYLPWDELICGPGNFRKLFLIVIVGIINLMQGYFYKKMIRTKNF